MSSLNKTIEAVLDQEHSSVWAFCSAIEESGKYLEDSRSCSMLAQGLREWASYRQSAHKEYESMIRRAKINIENLEGNFTIHSEVDADRVQEYNAKSLTQVEIVRTASYIIGLSHEAQAELFATVTKLQFNK
jgi:hypothetical protein